MRQTNNEVTWHDGQTTVADDKLSSEDEANYVRAKEKAIAKEFSVLEGRQLKDAYEQGVRDTLEDFKGRMRASSGFVWEPPLIEWVAMPAQQINGAIYPSHKAPVIIRPGRWVEENGITLPDVESPGIGVPR
jgi:hypothetical protein